MTEAAHGSRAETKHKLAQPSQKTQTAGANFVRSNQALAQPIVLTRSNGRQRGRTPGSQKLIYLSEYQKFTSCAIHLTLPLKRFNLKPPKTMPISIPKKKIAFVLAVLGLAFINAQSVDATQAVNALTHKGVYVGSEFYPPSTTWQDTARNSGFTRLFIFTLSVDSAGTLTAFNATLCQNGNYVGDPTWGSKLAACKASPSSVDRIEICIGSWGSTAFANIKNLIASQGTGTGSILYKNFLALKNATGVDAIQFDDETTYDVNSMVAFGNMLSGMGLKVTLCPYTQQAFWVNVKNQLGTKVDAIYLQCYDGGAGNNPISWNSAFGGFKVSPGLWGNTDSKTTVMTKMRSWNTTMGGSPGGFMWLNGNLPGDGYKWAGALKDGIGDALLRFEKQGYGTNAKSAFWQYDRWRSSQAYHYDYNDGASRWAIVPVEDGLAYKIMGYLSGKCVDVVGGSTLDNALVESRDYYTGHHDQQWSLLDAGNGLFNIQNRHSGKMLTTVGTADFSSVYQLTANGSASQKWSLEPQGNYYLNTFANNKYVRIYGGGIADGSAIVQYNWTDDTSFRWKFVNEGDGWHAVFSLHSVPLRPSPCPPHQRPPENILSCGNTIPETLETKTFESRPSWMAPASSTSSTMG